MSDLINQVVNRCISGCPTVNNPDLRIKRQIVHVGSYRRDTCDGNLAFVVRLFDDELFLQACLFLGRFLRLLLLCRLLLYLLCFRAVRIKQDTLRVLESHFLQ